jgi:tRNA A-37 threonylcarbamoyl transferase component Bud32
MSSLIGQSIGRYQILEQLGEGGMATVYKAYDTRLERFVAIKVIRIDQFAPSTLNEMMRRFEREAKALAQLSHPNIVHVHDYGEYEGAPYLVMEYLPCGTLAQRPSAPMPWQQAVHVLLPIAQALTYAHQHNIIHRDIKPGNILLTENGLPMLSDFGIAKILGNNAPGTITSAGAGIGTPEYMAPEQWTGQAGPQADIYSLGVVLYELVTGHKPYTADTPAGIMIKQVKDPLPPPRQFVPDLPEDLESVLIKALDRQPENRYQSMGELAQALENLTGGQTLIAGVKMEDLQAGKTVLAPGRIGQDDQLENVLAGDIGRPAAGPTPEIPVPPEKQRQISIRGRRWVAIAALAVVIFTGIGVGARIGIRSLQGKLPLAVPTQMPSQVLAGSQNSLPNPISATSPASPHDDIKVLWDISHGPRTSEAGTVYTPEGMYKSLAQALEKQKFVITSGDLTNLNSYDVLVISELSGTTSYTSNEVDKIEQFVRVSGHGLLILSDTPGFENLADSVGRKFSIGLGEITSDGPVSYSKESFFSGVTSLQFLSGGGVFQVTSPGQTAALDKEGNSVVAFCECDAGRVMAVSDANLWDNGGLSKADNQRFATNVFLWLAKLSP